MLVDTMSQAEITREIFLEWEILIEKTLPRIAQEYIWVVKNKVKT